MEEQKDSNKQEPKPGAAQEKEKESYSFMQETIKDETGSRKKTKNLIMKYTGLGLIFGVAASLSFFALKPALESRFQSNPKKVTISKEEDEAADETEQEAQQTPAPTLDINSYRQMNQALVGVANTVNKSVVEITGVMKDERWQDQAYDTANSVSGMLVADNGQEALIFAKSSVIDDAESFTASFCDGKSYTATVKGKDENLGFAIFAVAKSEIAESTWGQVQVATLGSSSSMSKGAPVIALGQPFNYASGMGFGVASSTKNIVEKADGEYRLLCTDIAGTKKGTGVLANTQGEIVGMIDQTVSEQDTMNLVTAYGITDLKDMVELLSNGEKVPYIGIKGITVTEQTAAEQGIPEGIYVQEVKADSPAMAAGIQSGDVITSVDGEDTNTLLAYHNVLMDQKEGSSVKIEGQRQGTGGYVDIDFNVTVGSKE